MRDGGRGSEQGRNGWRQGGAGVAKRVGMQGWNKVSKGRVEQDEGKRENTAEK